jgi:hypothetical protein
MAKPLEGGIAKIVGRELVKAGMSKPAVLIKVTPTARVPGAVTTGTAPTTVSHAAQGLVAALAPFQIANTLIKDVNRVVRLYASTIAGSAVPAPGDRITIEGTTSTIVNDDGDRRAVQRDAAGATYVCQCR